MKINTNYRSVQVLMGNSGERRFWSARSQLCDGCAHSGICPTLKSKKRLEKKSGASLWISECFHFSFCLVFQDVKGTDAPEFNTIRLGKAWGQRVRQGDVMGMINKAGEVYGLAEVQDIDWAEKALIVQRNAWRNHLYVNSGMTQEQAGTDLLRRMPSIYGNLIYKNNDSATVIWLKPMQ